MGNPFSGVGALKVVVRLFASYKEKVGSSTLEMELPEGATVARLADELLRRYPLTRDANTLVVAVNEEYADHDQVLNNGDEVALIPPVSGGFL